VVVIVGIVREPARAVVPVVRAGGPYHGPARAARDPRGAHGDRPRSV